ncbi:PREDICTED: N-alpha-acetyltransferase 16, NatA auxiliary subunit [Nelumbo nucifera]|uniref:N-alpha-acetyltransferase 16, NatA auxiliary subunit n=1 Tax=Nelumbo nucifera TaxID=4432 RepID=A0A1U7Z8W7_NELNU|nr:PREDICTED: N-alpha-acetyltransferase 16, NatA auxiliary subunit [Nelumbo nucifera]
MGASLPPKEANLFKLIVKSYETKQYKKGLKAADAILKKFPDHGETLSMKGLTLNCMDRKSEAYELVRRGLKNDLKSHVCWHVYGLLYRSDREYREAIKCYRNALKIDPDNIEILRDLSLLQAQMRDLTGFVETRQQLLTLKPNHRMNWIGFAVAHHLNSNGSKAIEILEAYEGTLEDDYPPENERCEHGEMLLYKVSLMEECGFLERALEELHKKESKIVDKLAFKEQEVSLLVKLGRLGEGEEIYRALLSMNPDNYRYYEGLQKCLGLYSENGQYSANDIDKLDALYKSLREQYTWSSAVKRIPLDFLQGEKFREAADHYIRPLLTKGVPSLFSDLYPLYHHPGKADILEQLILELEDSIRKTGAYPGRAVEPPSTLMWTLFLLAQHYDRRGQFDIALTKIDEAIDHTPTVIDLYSVKGRILKHAGDLVAAAASADEARSMDLADRFINSECVKRMLQADQVGLAEKTAVLFTKDGDQHNNLHDMQCMWYELASGESYCRQGDLGRALKKFLAVEKHYVDMNEDQFDFHSYCLRKMTLRAYVEMLKFQDRLHSHAYFHKAAAGAIRCYLKLYDSPSKSATEEDDEMSKLPPSLKKKMRQKQRKAEARAKKEAEEKNEESNAVSVSKSGKRQHTKPVDLDPNGEKLLQVEDPLLEATKYLKLLQKHSSDTLDTHLLSFEVNMRKQKVLLAFQAVKQLLRLDADNPDTHRCLIRFFHKVDSMAAPVTDSEKLIWKVLEAERPDLSQLHGKSLIEANSCFLEKHKDSLLHRASAAEMLFVLDPEKKTEAIKLVEDSTNSPVQANGALRAVKEWKLKDCIAVHKLLETVLSDPDAASRWKTRCAEYFPFSTYFEGTRSSAFSKSADHQEAGTSGDSHSLNGKLEDFNNLTI